MKHHWGSSLLPWSVAGLSMSWCCDEALSNRRRRRCFIATSPELPTTASTLHYNLAGASLQPRRSSNNRRGASLQPRRSFIATSAVLHGSTPTAAGEASLQRHHHHAAVLHRSTAARLPHQSSTAAADGRRRSFTSAQRDGVEVLRRIRRPRWRML